MLSIRNSLKKFSGSGAIEREKNCALEGLIAGI